MRKTKIYSFTSNFNNYDTLYKYAAILENIGNVTNRYYKQCKGVD